MTAVPDRLTRLARALAVVTTRPPVATASVPLQLRNPLNGPGGTTKGARYAANERRRAERMKGRTLGERLINRYGASTFIVVVLTRVSPKAFDSDNLEAAFKSVRDGMAEAWGINDADPRVTWVTDWRKGKAHAVEAALWVVPDAVADDARLVRMFALTTGAMPSDVEVDPDDYNGRPRVVVHGGLIQRREVRVTPNVVRAKAGF